VWCEAAGRKKGGCAHNTNCVNAIEPGVLAFLDLGEDEFIKALRAGLFHAFETETKVYRKGLVEGMVRVEYVDPAKDGTFVIGRTATVETASLVIFGQLEWREVPAV
jgi:hypothetical protein